MEFCCWHLIIKNFNHSYQAPNSYHHDLALLRVEGKPIQFTDEIMPICLPKSKRFPDSSGYVNVAGWGLQHESQKRFEKCKTGEHGPSPFSNCKFPFKTPGLQFSNFDCLKSQSPILENPICMELYRKMLKMNKTRLLEDGYGRVSGNTIVFFF